MKIRMQWGWAGLAWMLATGSGAAAAPVQDWVAVSPGGSGDVVTQLGENQMPAGSNLYAFNQGALAVDAAGNSYVTGSSHNGFNFDYLTQKFDAAGNLLWSARYNGPGNGEDRAIALAVDGNGDVVVTGTSEGIGTFADYATLKYSGATGAPLWSGGAVVNGAVRYNGPVNSMDRAVALRLDGNGDVVVTGSSDGGASGADYATLKYSGATGVSLWSGGAVVGGAARYDGPPGFGFDNPHGLALDGNGNVVVTGASYGGAGSDVDYATLKYSGATGAPLWSGGAIVNGAARYDGPINFEDVAVAVAVDGDGDVVVTGNSYGVNTAPDYATLKYSGVTGAPLWSGGAIVNGAARYGGNGGDEVRALALDADGDVFVTGMVSSFYATLKYSGSTGVALWAGGAIVDGAALYHGPGNGGADFPYALAVDGNGDVLVTGTSNGVANRDYATLKYSGASGATLWSGGAVVDGAVRYNGPGNADDVANAVALDANGDLRVAGTRRGSVNEDFGVVRYGGASGAQAWVASEGVNVGLPEQAGAGRALAVDAAGNSYVAASAHNGSNHDYVTRKFGPDGGLLWTAAYNGTGNGDDFVAALAVDANGDVVVTGRSRGSGSNFDYATLKYSGATGAPLWSGGAIVNGAARFNGPANGTDEARALALDGNGDVVVTGASSSGALVLDFATLKYSGATGAPLWSGGAIVSGAARYNGPVNGNDQANALAIDGNGDVVVTGTSLGFNFLADFATVKYSGATGATVWAGGAIDAFGAARYNGPGNGADEAFAMVSAANGDVLVTGVSAGSGTGADYATLRYSGATGAPVWSGGAIVNGAARYDGPASGTDRANALVLDGNGDVLVTGISDGNGTGADYATLKYSGATGAPLWSGGSIVEGAARYNGPGNGSDGANAVTLNGDGDVLVTGTSHGAGTNGDYATLKYSGADGAAAWAHRYDAGTSGDDQGLAVARAADESLRIAGTATTSNGERIVLLGLHEPGDNPALMSLTLTGHAYTPAFDADVTAYAATVGNAATLEITAAALDANASVAIGSEPAETGASIRTVPLGLGSNAIGIVVTAEDAVTMRTYTVTAYRADIALDPASLVQTYDGSARAVTATTQPAGVSYALSYAGIDGTAYGPAATPPVNAGRYAVTASLTDANFSGTTSGTLEVEKAAQPVLIASAAPDSILLGETSTLGTQGGAGSGAVSFAVTSGAAHCSVTGITLTGTSGGACTVTASKAGDVNFLPASATVEVTVTAPLRVFADGFEGSN